MANPAPPTRKRRAPKPVERTPAETRRRQNTKVDPVPGRRLAEMVALRIEQEIIERGWPVGETLGSEPELIERFGVSRAVFREAARIIEHHNVARMRRGPGGGLVISAPNPHAVQAAVGLYLRYVGVDREALFEARAALELAAVASAASMITEEGVAQMRDVLATEEEEGDRAILEAHSHRLHVVISEQTGNTAMTLFIEVLTRLNEDMLIPDSAREEALPNATASYHRAHVAIVEAIAAGNSGLAQHRMRRHLDAILRFSPDSSAA
jgi:DNA-binding FadR family transcriptional regulator